jgi:hypothetical protein
MRNNRKPKNPQVPTEPPAIVREIRVSSAIGNRSQTIAIRAFTRATVPNLFDHVSGEEDIMFTSS